MQAEKKNKKPYTDKMQRLLHDIANPLTIVQISLDLVYEELKDDQKSLLVEKLEKAMIGINQVNRIIVDSRQGRSDGAIKSSFSVVSELSKLLSFFELRCSLAGILIEADFNDDKMLTASLSTFQRAVSNLLLNSIEALENSKREPKMIKVSTTRTPKEFTMRISDSGPGISKKVRKELFRSVVSSKSKNRGRGLYTAAEIFSEMNARISVSNLVPAGASFTVTFPAK
ncbi:MAG: sensor histidine kinase [Candidatus Dojkabacteria bacterium]